MMLMPSCGEHGDGGDRQDAATTERPSPASTCDPIVGAKFVSFEELGAGLGPDGPVVAHLIVEFTQELVRFDIEDMSFTAPYDCDAGMITANVDGQIIRGTYDDIHDSLIWNGNEYRRFP
jgi:hypothetical protein